MQKEQKLKASIIIPVLNEERFIETCVESIIKNNDDLENMEILIVDGGSTDNTIEIVKSISSKYNFIRLLHNPNKITPSALNIAIKDSYGKFIVRLDAHAEYSKNYINRCIEILETSELVGKSIKDSNLPEEVRVGAIVRKSKVMMPKSTSVFEKNDIVVLLSKRDQLKEVENLFSITS